MSAEMITVCECQLYMCELNTFITQHTGKKTITRLAKENNNYNNTGCCRDSVAARRRRQ